MYLELDFLTLELLATNSRLKVKNSNHQKAAKLEYNEDLCD